MKKLLSLIFIFYILALTGCGTSPKAEGKVSENKSNNEIIQTENTATDESLQSEDDTQEDDSWKYEVAQRLYDEFCYFYDNMEEHEIIQKAMNTHKYVNRNAVGYNCVMAKDRSCGIFQVYYKYLSDEQLEDVNNKMFDLDYVDYFSRVQFGYSRSGLHFIAIYPWETEYGTAKKEAINEIRNLDDEFDFMSEFTDCCPVDLYVEDLSNRVNKININISFGNNNPINNTLNSSAEILKKYDRNYICNGNINIKTWNLYMFEKSESDDIVITTERETVKLLS